MDLLHTNPRNLVIEYRNAFYARGWANSKCGGIAIRESGFIYHLPRTEQNKIVAIPRAVAKSKVITGGDCSMLAQCFVPVGVGAVAHTTSTNGHIISERYRDHHQLDFQTFHREWSQILDQYIAADGTYRLPIVEDGANLADYPGSTAVLVRGHGIFVWGPSVDETIQRCEALETMLELAVEMNLQP